MWSTIGFGVGIGLAAWLTPKYGWLYGVGSVLLCSTVGGFIDGWQKANREAEARRALKTLSEIADLHGRAKEALASGDHKMMAEVVERATGHKVEISGEEAPK